MASPSRKVVWSPSARRQLDEAVEYVAQDSPSYARGLLERALTAAGGLSTLSLRGRVVPELGARSIREIFVGRYRLIYRVSESEVRIVAFLHGARELRHRRGRPKDEEE